MNREDIVRMLREADRASEYENRMPDLSIDYLPFFERFANLVAAVEREACAQIVVGIAGDDQYRWAAEAIIARGEK